MQQLEETHAEARQKVADAEASAATAQSDNVKLYEKVGSSLACASVPIKHLLHAQSCCSAGCRPCLPASCVRRCR